MRRLIRSGKRDGMDNPISAEGHMPGGLVTADEETGLTQKSIAEQQNAGGEVKVAERATVGHPERPQANRKSDAKIEPPTWAKIRRRIVVSAIVVMVFLHPSLTRRSVQLLTCYQLKEGDMKMYLRRDLGIECWVGSHIFWGMGIGLPFLLVYSIGIPLISLFVMFKRKHKLHSDLATVSRFGFLYLGCKCLDLLRFFSFFSSCFINGPPLTVFYAPFHSPFLQIQRVHGIGKG